MDRMLEIRSGRRIKVSVYQNEPKKPTLFFIHGLGGRGAQWREQVKHLQSNYTLIVPDLLGHGGSEKPYPARNNPYSFEELSQDLDCIFDRFASGENVVLGHSYGGAFASLLAQKNSTAIQKLVLIAPVSCQPFKQVPLVYLLPASVLEPLRTYLDKSFEKLAFAKEDDESLLKTEREARELNHMYVIRSLLVGMRRIPLLKPRELRTPALIIGGEQDRLIPNEGVRRFYGQLPNMKMVILAKAAHLAHLEQSAAVNLLLDDFLGFL